MSAAANRLPAEDQLASRPLGDGRFRTDLSIGRIAAAALRASRRHCPRSRGRDRAGEPVEARGDHRHSAELPALGRALGARLEAHLPSDEAPAAARSRRGWSARSRSPVSRR
jgi:hypothetical protein